MNNPKTRNNGVGGLIPTGKVPPHFTELEQAILGAIMIEPSCLIVSIGKLFPDLFYTTSHQTILQAILILYDKNKSIDLLTVVEQLTAMGEITNVGGAYYVSTLTNNVVSSANIETHIKLIQEAFIKREGIRLSADLMHDCFEDSSDAFDIVNMADMGFQKAQERVLTGMQKDMSYYGKKVLEEHANTKQTGVLGIKTGIKSLDKIMLGLVSPDLIIVAGRPGSGKCLGKGTKVIMFDGTMKKVEDLIVGDQLMGVDNLPRTIQSLAHGFEEMFEISQVKGITYTVNKSHILSLKRSRNEWRHKHGDILNIGVEDYLKSSPKFKTNYKGWKMAGFELPKKENIIPPYMLGVWLGDGTSAKPDITTLKPELINYIREYAEKNELKIREYKPRHNSFTLCLSGKERGVNIFWEQLKALNLVKNKHIPDSYLLSSKEDRLELLAGLVDTDGYINPQSKNIVEIIQKHEKLADNIKFLCNSLGFAVTKTLKRSKCQTGVWHDYYRLNIYGDLSVIPVKVMRKKGMDRVQIKSHLHTGIKVKSIGMGEYFGFTLDQDGLFLLEDCTVTHNTSFVLSLVYNISVVMGEPCAIFSLEMDGVQVTRRLISIDTQISHKRIREGKTTKEEDAILGSSVEKIVNSPIYIEDKSGINVRDIKTRAHLLKKKYGIKYIVIDYLQLMRSIDPKGKTRENIISEISGDLKILARDLEMPIIALSQLNRDVEKRENKSPQLSDLREGGSIEQDADEVMFIVRPEIYEAPGPVDIEGKPYSVPGLAVGEIAKNRHGPTKHFAMKFNGPCMHFTDHPSDYENEYPSRELSPVNRYEVPEKDDLPF